MHGTHVAGTIAAKANNATGVAGVAFNSSLSICKALYTAAGTGLTSDVANCINWTHTTRRQGDLDEPRRRSLDHAAAGGQAAWAGGGTGGSRAGRRRRQRRRRHAQLPGRVSEVVSVAATDDNDARASFSNANADVEVAAPGVDVLSTIPGGQYATLSGTSMATPHASGVAGVLWELFPTETAAGIRSRLDGAVDDLGPAGRDQTFGFGRVNLCKGAGGGC